MNGATTGSWTWATEVAVDGPLPIEEVPVPWATTRLGEAESAGMLGAFLLGLIVARVAPVLWLFLAR